MSDRIEKDLSASTSKNVNNICPVCKKPFKVVLQHLNNSIICRKMVTDKQMEPLFEASKQNKLDRDKRNRKRKQMEDPEKFKENANRRKAKQRDSAET